MLLLPSWAPSYVKYFLTASKINHIQLKLTAIFSLYRENAAV
jgi:hypothetical protein